MMKQLKGRAITLLLCTFAVPHLHSQTQSGTLEPSGQAQFSDLHFVLSTKDGRVQFRLGEAIEIEASYSSSTPNKYLLTSLGLAKKVKEWRSLEFNVEPAEHAIDRMKDTGSLSAFAILNANCLVGKGSGGVGACADCDGETPLTSSPIRVPYSLTAQFQILDPGHYVIGAQTADVVLAPLSVDSHSIPVASNKVEIDVMEDPQWSANELANVLARFEKAKLEYAANGWDKIPHDRTENEQSGKRAQLEYAMQKAAETMRILDTEGSLAEIVRLYDGPVHTYDYSRYLLYRGIIQSKHQLLAVKLLSQRMLEPDFSVSKDLLDQLTAMALRNQFPEAFSRDDADSRRRFYPDARKILHDNVLALGKSLAKKSPDALGPSLVAFRSYAAEDFCTGNPLIPQAVTKKFMQQVKAFDSAPEE